MGRKFDLSATLAAQAALTPTPDGPRDIDTITREILDCKVRAGEAILEIGRCLIEAKEQLAYGAWGSWLTEQVEFSERQAQRFMRLANEWSNPTALSDLGATKALSLLALSPAERDDFIAEAHSVNGTEKTVIDMSARELEKAIREREEARAEQKAAEAACAQMEADMRVANDRLYAMDAEIQQRERTAREADARAAALREELEALKAQPVEITGTAIPDEATLAAARAEGAEAAKVIAQEAAKTARKEAEDKLKKKLEQAEQEKTEALEALAHAKAEEDMALNQVRADRDAAEARALALEKKLKLAGSPDAAAFQFHFTTIGQEINELLACLQRLRDAGETELHDKLTAALAALCRGLQDSIPAKLEGGVSP